MYPRQSFGLVRQVLLLAIVASIYPMTGHAAVAGRVDFSIGQVVAVATDGSQRALQKGSEVSPGDAINTSAGARAQIRFTDGSYVSLQPNTQFRVDQYRYDGKADGDEKGFFSLLKGGLRTITGIVGRANRDNYRVATPAATIGIRGTGYNAALAEGLSISVTDGVISLVNQGGTLIISQGQSAYVADMNTAPSLTFEKPSTPPASLSSATEAPPPKQEQYVGGDDEVTDDGIISGGIKIVTGVRSVSSGTVVDGAGGVTSVVTDYPGIVAFDELGNRVVYVQGGISAGGVTYFESATLDQSAAGTDTVGAAMLGHTYPATGKTIPAAGYDDTVAWGRFYGTLIYVDPVDPPTVTTLTANQGIHSVVGIPTAAMPTSGSAHFELAGATRPTLASGVVAPGSVSGGGLDVWFGASPELLGVLTLAIGSKNYNLMFDGNFSGNSFIAPNTSAVSGNGGCSGACTAQVYGVFAGANAARAGVAYSIGSNTLDGTEIRGAAVYSRTGSSALSYPPSGW